MRAAVEFVIVGAFLCTFFPMTLSTEDYTEDEQMILSLIGQDDSQPESGTEPSADFYRCNKVGYHIFIFTEKPMQYHKTNVFPQNGIMSFVFVDFSCR